MSIKHIDLGRAHEFPDLTPIPPRLWKSFDIEVFDDMEADGDWAVSDCLHKLGVWEPVETAVLSSAFAGAKPQTQFLDFGAHIGWYTAIARQWGLPTAAFDASEDCCLMIAGRSDPGIRVMKVWVDEELKIDHITAFDGWDTIIKLDIEGAEQHVVKQMAPAFKDHRVTVALIEMSPVFNTSYPHIATSIINAGYECWVLPAKQTPPPLMDDTREWLTTACFALHGMPEKMRNRWINNQHQFNAVFCLEEAKWG